jgi:hypothetical protein
MQSLGTRQQIAPGHCPGLLMFAGLIVRSVNGDDRAFVSKELVIDAQLEDMLVGTHVLSEPAGGEHTNTRAGLCEVHVFGTETQIIVFKFGGPVIGESIFQTEAD